MSIKCLYLYEWTDKNRYANTCRHEDITIRHVNSTGRVCVRQLRGLYTCLSVTDSPVKQRQRGSSLTDRSLRETEAGVIKTARDPQRSSREMLSLSLSLSRLAPSLRRRAPPYRHTTHCAASTALCRSLDPCSNFQMQRE